MLQSRQSGFTLLEVIMAMALTGFVLGSLFSLVGGSKQLSWRSEASLVQAMKLRAATNFALLQDEYSEIEPILEDSRFEIQPLDILEEPERKTQASVHNLESFTITDTETNQSITGNRWIRLELQQ